MNGCTVWYRLDVAVHNYSYLIIKINNYNELPTFLHVYMYTWYTCIFVTAARVAHFASSYVDGCRIFVVRVNLLVLTRPNLAGLTATLPLAVTRSESNMFTAVSCYVMPIPVN